MTSEPQIGIEPMTARGNSPRVLCENVDLFELSESDCVIQAAEKTQIALRDRPENVPAFPRSIVAALGLAFASACAPATRGHQADIPMPALSGPVFTAAQTATLLTPPHRTAAWQRCVNFQPSWARCGAHGVER